MNNGIVNLLILFAVFAIGVSAIIAYMSAKAGKYKEKAKGTIENNKTFAKQAQALSNAALSSIGDVGEFLLKRADRKRANNDNSKD